MLEQRTYDQNAFRFFMKPTRFAVFSNSEYVPFHSRIKTSACVGKTYPYRVRIFVQLSVIMAWLFTECNVARNSQVLHWNFSIPRATSYSVNSQATVPSWLASGPSSVQEGTALPLCTAVQAGYSRIGPRQANLVLTAYASSEDSGEPAHPRSLARTSAARSYKRWVKRNLQTESQIPGSSEWLGMRG